MSKTNSDNSGNQTEGEKGFYNKWTDAQKLALARAVQKSEGYKRTAVKMEKKWRNIAEILATHVDFVDVPKFNGPALQTQFKRFMKAVKRETGHDNQRFNLSALEKEPNEYQKTMLDMEEDIFKSKGAVIIQKDIKGKLQNALFGHEQEGLRQQGQIDLSNPSFLPATAGASIMLDDTIPRTTESGSIESGSIEGGD